MTYLVVLLVILAAVYYKKTSSGLAFAAIGENPQSADAAGISVYRYQWIAIVVNGVMGGIGGAVLVLVQLGKILRKYDFWTWLHCTCCGNIRKIYAIWCIRSSFCFRRSKCTADSSSGIRGFRYRHRRLQCFHMFITLVTLLISIGKSNQPDKLGKTIYPWF